MRKFGVGLILVLLILTSFSTVVDDVYGIGTSYDLTASITPVTSNSPISVIVVDQQNSIVYFATQDGKLGYYNQTSNTAVDLTPLISGWVGANYIVSGTVDTIHNRFYFTAGQIMNLWGYYSLKDNAATQLIPTWWYMTHLQYDKEMKVIWYASNNNEFGYINTTTNTLNIITTSGFGDICIDYQDERVYVVSANGITPPFYYDKNTTSIVSVTSIPFYTLGSCDIDVIHHRIYMGRMESFQNAGYYLPDTDTWISTYWNGDSVYDEVTRYLPSTNTVGILQSGIYGSIYNISDNSTVNLLTTEHTAWMDSGYSGLSGDYMNNSRRLYMGFSDGSFGYYFDGIGRECYENWTVHYTLCQSDDTTTKYYIDNNICGDGIGLPIDNGSQYVCNYCSESLRKNYLTSCNLSGLIDYQWVDDNYYSCCVVTGLITDCDILSSPYNETAHTENCTVSYSDFVVETDVNADFGLGQHSKVFGKAYLNTTGNYSCISYVKTDTDKIIQTNPVYTKETNALLKGQYDDRQYFPADNGLVNVYWTDDHLVIDGRKYIFGIDCAGDIRLRGEKVVTVGYQNLNAPITIFFALSNSNNIMAVIIVILFLLVLVIIAGLIWRARK